MINTISKIFENWKTARATRAAAKRKLIASFSRFVEETRPLTPKAGKHPIAALYRHVWKRAVVLENIATTSGDHDSVSLYKQFQEIAVSSTTLRLQRHGMGKLGFHCLVLQEANCSKLSWHTKRLEKETKTQR